MDDDLIVWDRDARMLLVVDRRFGSAVKTIRMPQVDRVIASDVERGELYATGTDGRLLRLQPRE
jgi:hypothetical protein